jgi:hypothetical protein
MAEVYKSDEEYIFKAEFDEDRGLMFFPTGESIVRCKDCKLFDAEHEGGIGSCGIDMNVTANDYCSKAERKDEVGE